MVFVGAAILPHGTMAFDGDPNSASPACRERNSTMPPELIQNCSKLYNSCERAGDLVAKMNPDIVLLVTPHGLALSSGSYAVYMANAARGNALWNGCFQDIEVNIPLETQLSGQLLEFVQKQGFKADGIITFTKMESPLRWGEVVPLWFVDKKLDSEKVKYMIVCLARNGEGFEAMGRSLHEFASKLQHRLAVVISGDLSHTHETTCDIPLYLPGKLIFFKVHPIPFTSVSHLRNTPQDLLHLETVDHMTFRSTNNKPCIIFFWTASSLIRDSNFRCSLCVTSP